jgi:hypothetical protein
MASKIALIGSAPSSRDLAPFNDPEWEIWTCSPSNMDLPRSDVFFEIHAFDLMARDPSLTGFLTFLTKHPKVYLQKENPHFPNALAYPKDEMVAKYGPYFFTSSLAYMWALALEQKPTHVGMWGVDMTATEEYGYQRAGCHYFIQKARDIGVQVVVPVESDILAPTPQYGFRELNPQYRKLLVQRRETVQKYNEKVAERDAANEAALQYSGAIASIDYMINTWAL